MLKSVLVTGASNNIGGAFEQGLANALAEHLKAPCYTLAELKAENLYRAVRAEIEKA